MSAPVVYLELRPVGLSDTPFSKLLLLVIMKAPDLSVHTSKELCAAWISEIVREGLFTAEDNAEEDTARYLRELFDASLDRARKVQLIRSHGRNEGGEQRWKIDRYSPFDPNRMAP